MKNILDSISKSLENKNWYSALVLSLIVPDICGQIENSKESSRKRYSKWFNKYLGKQYDTFLSGDDCYALRCSFLHEGSGNIEEQKAQDVLDRFVFISKGAHCNRVSNCDFGGSRYDGKDFLQLSTFHFCQDIINATNEWLSDVKNDEAIQKNVVELLKIHEGGFSIGNAISFK